MLNDNHRPIPPGYEAYLRNRDPKECSDDDLLKYLPATNMRAVPVIFAESCRPVSQEELDRKSPFRMNFKNRRPNK